MNLTFLGTSHKYNQIVFVCWNSNTLAIWCKELTHWKRPRCWERLKAGGEGDDRGWDGWKASPTQWTWVWTSSGSWELVKHRETWHAAVHGVTKSWPWLSDWTECIWEYIFKVNLMYVLQIDYTFFLRGWRLGLTYVYNYEWSTWLVRT